ncbi:hypothetical protein PIB30_040066 [Stylosanthes scabra]|uniref:Uncharacterized protein n=1 Tax=Stylosanthes scabra TaxID=79078 RepID=A0ABU6VCY5_9FABA|nr:hypothetical protein [Stylosanthes scabra]
MKLEFTIKEAPKLNRTNQRPYPPLGPSITLKIKARQVQLPRISNRLHLLRRQRYRRRLNKVVKKLGTVFGHVKWVSNHGCYGLTLEAKVEAYVRKCCMSFHVFVLSHDLDPELGFQDSGVVVSENL